MAAAAAARNAAAKKKTQQTPQASVKQLVVMDDADTDGDGVFRARAARSLPKGKAFSTCKDFKVGD